MNIKKVTEDIENSILNGNKNNAVNIFKSIIDCRDTEKIKLIDRIRRKGLFRASHYNFSNKSIEIILELIKLSDETIKFPIAIKSYFESVKNILYIGFSVASIYKEIIKHLNKKDIKTILVGVELLFWNDHFKEVNSDREKFLHFSREELSQGFSYYYFLLNQSCTLSKEDFGLINGENILNGKAYSTITELTKINYYKEVEVLIDYFEYAAIRNKSNIIIEHPDKTFEKSIKAGFTQQNIQLNFSNLRHSIEESTKAISLIEVASMLVDKFKSNLFSIKEFPVKRIVMAWPDIKEFYDLLFSTNSIFREEEIELYTLAKELLVDLNTLTEKNIYKSITVIDIIKLQRLTRLIYWAFDKYAIEQKLKNTPLFFQSLLPVYKYENFEKILKSIFPESKAKELLEYLSWNDADNSIFDLQSTPLISCDSCIVLPLSLFSISNIVRNKLQSSRFRFDAESNNDPLGELLSKKFSEIASYIKRNINYEWNGEHGEVDFLAIFDNILFVMECKNSLYPCNSFELRTSCDYIKKGARQLSKFISNFNDINFKEYFFKQKLKIDYKELTSPITGIITGNRMFYGWRQNGHPVRSIYELFNFIDTGEISINEITSKGKEERIVVNCWQGNKFTGKDLSKYFKTNFLQNFNLDSMFSIDEKTKIRGKTLIKKTFATDVLEQFNQLKKIRDKQR